MICFLSSHTSEFCIIYFMMLLGVYISWIPELGKCILHRFSYYICIKTGLRMLFSLSAVCVWLFFPRLLCVIVMSVLSQISVRPRHTGLFSCGSKVLSSTRVSFWVYLSEFLGLTERVKNLVTGIFLFIWTPNRFFIHASLPAKWSQVYSAEGQNKKIKLNWH